MSINNRRDSRTLFFFIVYYYFFKHKKKEIIYSIHGSLIFQNEHLAEKLLSYSNFYTVWTLVYIKYKFVLYICLKNDNVCKYLNKC